MSKDNPFVDIAELISKSNVKGCDTDIGILKSFSPITLEIHGIIFEDEDLQFADHCKRAITEEDIGSNYLILISADRQDLFVLCKVV